MLFSVLDAEKLFLLMLTYSFGGWTIETLGELIKSKKVVNRGFLIGPICPIYGIGAVIITILLGKYADDLFAVFGLSAIICGALEYFTSYIMEKLFKARWWDYSDLKFNINGRICLETIVLFAIAGVIIVRYLTPSLLFLFSNIPSNILNVISIVFLLVFIIDVIISFNVMNRIKNLKQNISINFKDNTEEISAKVREILLEKSMPYRRILEAFPQAFSERIKVRKEQIVKTAVMIKENVHEATEKAKETANNVKEKTHKRINEIKRETIINIVKGRYKIRRLYLKKQGKRDKRQ